MDRDKIAEAWLLESKSLRDIADEQGISGSKAMRTIDKMGMKGRQGDAVLYSTMYVEIAESAIQPIRLVLPKLPKPHTTTADEVWLHWGDVHYPFHDPKAVDVLYQIAADLRPSHLMCHGDLADMWQISDYLPPLERLLKPDQVDMQDTLEMITSHLGTMVALTGAKERHFLEGNHEERFERMLTKLQKDTKMAALMRIPMIAQVLDLDYLLGISELGFTYRRYMDPPLLLNDKLVAIHGYRANKYYAHTMLNMYGKSTIAGHTHRIQSATKGDLRGTDAAWNIGCLCDLNQPYTHYTDWAHGFAVVTWKDGLFNTEQIRIHDGRAIFRDKIYKA